MNQISPTTKTNAPGCHTGQNYYETNPLLGRAAIIEFGYVSHNYSIGLNFRF
jgi:hypothetical protein